ncbi:MAG: lipoprotein insertase outer membrane protein LolB [Steroidobacterales bacterium]
MIRLCDCWPRVVVLHACLLLGACAAMRPPAAPAVAPAAWDLRMSALQQAVQWGLDGRAAASAGKQGWQASITWRQQGSSTELHLAGPLGVGASVLRLTPEGLSVDGAQPRSDVMETLRERLGIDLPLASLRYWLLGVPDPGTDCTLTRNAQDRPRQLIQSGWTIDVDRYVPVDGDWLPGQLAVQREGVRVRIAVDHWDFPR